MPPKKATTAAAAEGGGEKTGTIFTARDQEILTNAFMCFKEFPVVDFDHLAARCGMTNPRSASNAWALIRKKIIAHHESAPTPVDSDGNPLAPIAPVTTPGKRKADVEADDSAAVDNGEGSSTGITKTSTKRARATPASRKKAISDENADDENGTMATPTKVPRKRAPKKTTATPASAKGKGKSKAIAESSDSEAEVIIKKEQISPITKISLAVHNREPFIKQETTPPRVSGTVPIEDEHYYNDDGIDLIGNPTGDHDASPRVLHPDD
ncbi:hypothetical protein B0T14DRAFT_495684 [Immersiella caudata]|uniref:Uncharacterized protein n=1 Tax=Immersiella caudata TaxID=314043 RepID=A0AA39WZJ2_9PEZI|nr:hypothetical protein B0T14DRAFT_495684 [Immersiella caudata]